MITTRKKLDLVTKLEALQSVLDESHSSNGIIKKYITSFKVNTDIDTNTLTNNMLREFKVYDWVQPIGEFCANITESLAENKVELAIESTLYKLKQNNKFNSYNSAISIVEGILTEENIDIHEVLVKLKESNWIPEIKSLTNMIEISINAPVTESANVTISKVYSPVDILSEGDSESYLFMVDNKLYEMVDNEIQLSNKKPSVLFNRLLSVCEAFNISENKLKINHKKHTIEILLGESKEIFVDGRKVEESNLESTLTATGSFYINEMYKLELIKFAASNAEKIQELDFATRISSNIYEGLVTNIFKLDESVFVNTINSYMMKNELNKAETSKDAVKLVKEFVNYDASNLLKENLIKEENEEQILIEAKAVIEEKISFLNEQLGNIYEVENEIGTVEELTQAKEIIKEALDIENSNLSKLLTK